MSSGHALICADEQMPIAVCSNEWFGLGAETMGKMMEATLKCPTCGAADVVVTTEQMFMVNSGEHYCHSVKTHDDDAKAACLDCGWRGERKDLVTAV